MKKLTTVVTLFAFTMMSISCSGRMDTRTANKNSEKEAGKNKTEGYFYHHSEESLNNDSTKVKKNVNN